MYREHKYFSKNINKYARYVSFQLKWNTINPADPVKILTFMTELEDDCDQEKTGESSYMCVSSYSYASQQGKHCQSAWYPEMQSLRSFSAK